MEQRYGERERALLKQLIESRVFREAKKQGQERREGCFTRERQGRHNMAPFREGPVWDPRCQELGTLSIVV
jgi:hypothetical protein